MKIIDPESVESRNNNRQIQDPYTYKFFHSWYFNQNQKIMMVNEPDYN